MPRRVPQPHVDRLKRPAEHHDFWPGFVVTVIGVFALVGGLRRVTGIETVAGGGAWETQLVKAFSTGGLQYQHPKPPMGPTDATDPSVTAAALKQWEQAAAGGPAARRQVRVNTSAATPCPT